jgi:hypothetical protein
VKRRSAALDDHLQGQTFNPAYKSCGFYPHEAVCRQRDLTDGQKLLYTRLVQWAGKNGECWYGFQTMAEELGKSERQVRYDMEALESYGLVRHAKRHGANGRRLTNKYEFIWHQIFDVQGQPTACGEDLSHRQSTACGPPAIQRKNHRQSNVKTTGNGSPGSKENHKEESSIEGNSTDQGRAGCSIEKKIHDDEIASQQKPEQPTPPKAQQPAAWYDTNVVPICQKELARIRGNGEIPDTDLAVRVLDAFDSRESYDAWIADFSRRKPAEIRSWGLFPTDAQTSMERRRKSLRQAQQAKAEEERRLNTPMDPRKAIAESGWEYRSTDALLDRLERRGTQITPLEARDLIRNICQICQEKGTVGSKVQRTFTYCSCDAGIELRDQKGPDWPAEETERMQHACLQARLAAALEETGHRYFGEAIGDGDVKIVQNGHGLVFRVSGIFSRDPTLKPALEQAFGLLGEPSRDFSVEVVTGRGAA